MIFLYSLFVYQLVLVMQDQGVPQQVWFTT